jgi:histone H3/H4
MSSEVINVGKIMRQEAYFQTGKKKKIKNFRISKNAVQEEIGFLKALIETHIAGICERLNNTTRTTIQEEDIIQENGIKTIIQEQSKNVG